MAAGDDDPGEQCAICGGWEYDKDNMSRTPFKINTACGHFFHDACIDREFATRRSRSAFKCPLCQAEGRDREVLKQNLEYKRRAELECELDTVWRKRVTEVFGKTEEDFVDQEEYNNYVERKEDLIYRLASRLTMDDLEVRQAEKELEAERRANEEAIAKYKARREDERRRVARTVEQSNRKWDEALKAAKEVESLMAERRKEYRRQLQEVNMGERDSVTVRLDEPITAPDRGLANGTEDEDDDMVEVYRPESQPVETVAMSLFNLRLAQVAGEQPAITEQPAPPSREDARAVARASGWGPQVKYRRAWEEAMAGLFVESPEARNRLGKAFSSQR